MDYEQPMTLIADPALAETLQKDFASIGFDDIRLIVPEEHAGAYIDDRYENISPEAFTGDHKNKNILDVRTKSEYGSGNLENAVHLHFGHISSGSEAVPFDRDDEIYVHCQSGVRSAIAASALKAEGYGNVINVEKGYNGIKAELDKITNE